MCLCLSLLDQRYGALPVNLTVLVAWALTILTMKIYPQT
jgi:hypothetical protein